MRHSLISQEHWRPPTQTVPNALQNPFPTRTRRAVHWLMLRRPWLPPTQTAPNASPRSSPMNTGRYLYWWRLRKLSNPSPSWTRGSRSLALAVPSAGTFGTSGIFASALMAIAGGQLCYFNPAACAVDRARGHSCRGRGRSGTGAAKEERSIMPEPRIVLSGLGIPESPRWHEGRLWFCNWIDRQVVAVDLDGEAEVMLTRDPASHPMGYSIGWLPDGRLLTTGAKLERQEPDGSMVTIAEQHANEIVVDGRGHVYVHGADF